MHYTGVLRACSYYNEISQFGSFRPFAALCVSILSHASLWMLTRNRASGRNDEVPSLAIVLCKASYHTMKRCSSRERFAAASPLLMTKRGERESLPPRKTYSLTTAT